jgi:hypothetical protein
MYTIIISEQLTAIAVKGALVATERHTVDTRKRC